MKQLKILCNKSSFQSLEQGGFHVNRFCCVLLIDYSSTLFQLWQWTWSIDDSGCTHSIIYKTASRNPLLQDSFSPLPSFAISYTTFVEAIQYMQPQKFPMNRSFLFPFFPSSYFLFRSHGSLTFYDSSMNILGIKQIPSTSIHEIGCSFTISETIPIITLNPSISFQSELFH